MVYFLCNWKNKICNNIYITVCTWCKQLESGFKRTINLNKNQSKLGDK